MQINYFKEVKEIDEGVLYKSTRTRHNSTDLLFSVYNLLREYKGTRRDSKMPSDGNFAFRILIGRVPQPEYVHDGSNYVESNLWTPSSYQQEISEVVDGEKEVQHFPVTPYEILLRLGRHCEASAFFIYVDGVLVTKVLLEKGETR